MQTRRRVGIAVGEDRVSAGRAQSVIDAFPLRSQLRRRSRWKLKVREGSAEIETGPAGYDRHPPGVQQLVDLDLREARVFGDRARV